MSPYCTKQGYLIIHPWMHNHESRSMMKWRLVEHISELFKIKNELEKQKENTQKKNTHKNRKQENK